MKRFLFSLLLLLVCVGTAPALERNTGSQYIEFYAVDVATGAPKTGDAGNITAYQSIDGGAVTILGDTSATEMSATNALGVYRFDLTAGETNGKSCVYTAKSSTSGVYVYPRFVYTDPPNLSVLSINGSGYIIVQDDSITAAKIANGAIGATEIADASIDAATFASAAITADSIATAAIGAAEIDASAIGASEIGTGAIDADSIATDAITDTKIAAGAITNSELAADAIGESELAAGAITTSEIATAAIDADAIATDAVGSAEVSAAAVLKIANGGPLLWAGEIDTVNSQTSYVLYAVGSGTATLAAGQIVAFYDATAASTVPSIRIVTGFDSATSTLTINSAPDFIVAVGDDVRIYPAHNSITTITNKLPSKAYLTGSANSDGDVELNEATGTLPANSVTSSVIANDAIGATEIANSSIDAATFAAAAVDAAAIAPDAIGASEIANSAIDTATFVAGAVDSTVIGANAIGASQIATNAIGAAEVADDTVREMNGLLGYGLVVSLPNTTTIELDAAYDGSQLVGQIVVVLDTAGTLKAARTITGGVASQLTVDAAHEAWLGTNDYYVIIPSSTYITTIKNKLPSKAYLTGTANSDGDVQLNEATGALAADTITNTAIAADAIGATEIANDAIDAATLATDTITNTKIAADAIGNSEIATDAIGAFEIAGSAIGAAELANDAITVDAIAAGAIDSGKFAAGAITASAVATGAIDADAIATDAIGSLEIAADAIGPAEVANDTIDALSIAADAITSAKIAADSIGASELATDSIGAAEIAGSAIGTSELATGALTNDEVATTFLQTFITVNSGVTSASAIDGSVVKETSDLMSDVFNNSTITLDPDVLDQIADSIWNEVTTGHTTPGTFGEQLKTDVDAILDDTGSAGVVLANDAITNTKIAADAIGASELATDAIGAAEVAADTIGASELAADAIGAAELATDAIGATEVAAGTGTELASATWDLATAGHVTAGTFGEQVKTDGDVVETRVGTLYTDWINGGRLDLLLDAVATEASLTAVGGDVTAIKTTTDKLDTAMELDVAVYRFTANSLELAAGGGLSAAGIADAVWDELQAGHVIAGSFGAYLDASVSTSGSGGAGAIADAVWDEATAGHVGAGTFGAGVKLADGSITATTIGTAAIDADAIASDAVGALELADNAIDAGAIATDAITNTKIAADAIGAAEVANDTIDATAIANDAIDATAIADNAIDATAIASNAITSAKIATDAIGAAQIAAGSIGTSELATTVLGASYNSSTDSLEAIRDRIDASPPTGTAGGGTLTARLSDSSLSPRRRFEIIQGEQKTITFVTEAAGRFSSATPTAITIKLKDANGVIITKANADVVRITEEADLQVNRITLTPAETASLRSGYVQIELSFDGEKAILTTSLYIIAGL